MKRCSRRDVLRWAGLGMAMACMAPRLRAEESVSSLAGRRPNIILILSDDQGYGDVDRHGHPFLKTPRLDRMHDESLRFSDFQVSPYCVPTRAALMTGINPAKCGITGCRWRLTPTLTTIADVLRSAGYATGIFGKWHLGYYEKYRPERHGFDEVFVFGGGALGSPYGDFPGNRYFNPVIYHNGTPEETRGFCTDVFFGQARRWMQSVRREKPFFTYLAPNAPHEPFVAPGEDAQPYRDLVRKFPKNPSFFGQVIDYDKMANYYGMIANLDRNVGRLLDSLATWEIERDTLVIYMNDNGTIVGGGYWNAGMRGSKATVYNGGTRAMAFWRWPGTLENRTVTELAAHLDVFPTLAALAGASIPPDVAAQLDGRSLLPLLEDGAAPWPDRMLFDHQGTWRQGNSAPHIQSACTIRWRKYHLLRNTRVCASNCPLCGTVLNLVFGGRDENLDHDWELYDLLTDPGERNNIAREKPAITAKLAKAYDAWWQSVQPYQGDDTPPEGHTNPLPFPALYWKHYQGPGPNNVPPPEGFLASVTARPGTGDLPEGGTPGDPWDK